MKFIGKPMIALALILVAILFIPDYNGAFGSRGYGNEGSITCPGQQKSFNINSWAFVIYDFAKPPPGFGHFLISVPDYDQPGTLRERYGVLTSGIIQRSPDGSHLFVLQGQMRQDGICLKNFLSPSTAAVTIMGKCDGSSATFTSSDGSSATFTNLHYVGRVQDPTRSEAPDLLPFCVFSTQHVTPPLP